MTLCWVIYLFICDEMIGSRMGFLSGSSNRRNYQNYRSLAEMKQVCADKWTRSDGLWCGTWLRFLTKAGTFWKQPKKLPLKQKKVITDITSAASKTCHTPATLQLLFPVCVFVYAPVFTGVHLRVLPSGPLKLHTLLSGLSSQQAHLEMRFKTAINIKLCGKRGNREWL